MAHLHVKLQPGRDDDIIAWLEAQENKSAAVRAAIRRAMAPPLDPAELKAVVRAAVAEALRGKVVVGGKVDGPEEDPELAAALDSLF